MLFFGQRYAFYPHEVQYPYAFSRESLPISTRSTTPFLLTS